jgi:hypothetical protein
MEVLGSTGRDRVMLMHDRPPPIDFAKANGQAKIELNFISVCLSSGKAHKSSGKRPSSSRGYVLAR